MGWIEEEEDLSIFTDNEFSTVAIVDGANSALTAVTGIFDINYDPMFGSSEEVEGRNITFLVETALIENLHHRASLTIKDKKYQIKGIEPIDDGKLTCLKLKEDFS